MIAGDLVVLLSKGKIEFLRGRNAPMTLRVPDRDIQVETFDRKQVLMGLYVATVEQSDDNDANSITYAPLQFHLVITERGPLYFRVDQCDMIAP